MRSRSRVVWLAVALALPAVLAADGNPRDPPLETASDATTVTAMAVAPTSGHVLLGTLDPGSELPTADAPRDVDTWFLYDGEGNTIHSGSADHPECVTRVQDMCQSPVTAVSVTYNGKRFAVAAQVEREAAVLDPAGTRGVLHLGTDQQGIVRTVNFPDPVRHVRLSNMGEYVFVVTEPSATAARASFWAWDGSGAGTFSQIGGWVDIGGPVRALAHEPALGRVILGADRHYVVDRGNPVAVTKSSSSSVTSVGAVGLGAGPSYSIAGTDAGTLAYFDHAAANLAIPQKSLKPGGSTGITAAAASPDKAHFAVGAADGRLFLYARTGVADDPFRQVLVQDMGDDDVRDLHFAAEGKWLVLRVGDEVQMHELRGDKLVPLWSHEVAGARFASSVASGAQTVVAGGAQATVFEALRLIEGVPPAAVDMLPKASKEIEVTYRNAGNRPESISLTLGYPTGWFMSVTPDNLTLDPDQEAKVTVKVVSGAGAAPGLRSLHLNHTIGTRAFSTPIQVNIPTDQRLFLFDHGPRSLAVRPGETVVFSVLVTNAGNVPITANLAATVTPGWSASISQPRVELEGGQEKPVTVQMAAPRGANEGDSGQLVVRLEEDPSQQVVLTGTVGARFGVQLGGASGVQLPAGNQTTVDLLVKNLGNAPDGFVISYDRARVPATFAIGFLGGQDTQIVRGVAPGETATVSLLVRAPADAPVDSTLVVVLTAVSEGDATQKEGHNLHVNIVEPGTPPPTTNGGGGSAALWLVLGVVVLLVVAAGIAIIVLRGRGAD